MKQSSDIYQLIKTLNKQEKRYFKMYASRHTRSRNTNLIRLFDELDKLPEYNECKLAAAIGDTAFYRNLASTANKLYKTVVGSLVAFHAGKSVESELRDLLASIAILFNKGLYDQCRKHIRKARSKAEHFEKYGILIDVLRWQRRVALKSLDDSIDEELRDIAQAAAHASKGIATEARYGDVSARVQATHRRGTHNTLSADDQNGIPADELLQEPERAHTFASRRAYWKTLGFAAWRGAQFAEARDHYHKLLAVWEDQPHQIDDDPDSYRFDLANYLACCLSLRRLDDVPDILARIADLPSQSLESEVNLYQHIYPMELSYCLNCGLLDRGARVVRQLSSGLQRFRDKIPADRLVSLHINCAIVFFLHENYRAALGQLQAILQQERRELRRDSQEFARVFRLVLHFELGDTLALEHLLRQTAEYIRQQPAANVYAAPVIRCLRRLLNSPDKSHAFKRYTELRSALLPLWHDAPPPEPLGLLELLFWLQSKLQNTSMASAYGTFMERARTHPKNELFISA